MCLDRGGRHNKKGILPVREHTDFVTYMKKPRPTLYPDKKFRIEMFFGK
jgi:hypothetical protein